MAAIRSSGVEPGRASTSRSTASISGSQGASQPAAPHRLRHEGERTAGVVGGLDLGDQDALVDELLEEGGELVDADPVAAGDRRQQLRDGRGPFSGLLEKEIEDRLRRGPREHLEVALPARRGGAPEDPDAAVPPRSVGLGRGTMAGQAARSAPTQAATLRASATESSTSSRAGRLSPVTRASSPPIQARAVAQKTALGLVLVAKRPA